ncbi:MAG TPA: hypothetical protein VGL15_00515 [Vicinamibacteria bacterium]|jgi:hypothetical protein
MKMPPRALGRLAAEAMAAVFFLALAAFFTRPLVLHLADHTLVGGDPIVDMWTIHWLVTHFFTANQVFQGNTFFPSPNAVLFSDLTLGTVVLLLPLRPFLRDPVLLYNVAVLLTLAFAGWSFHLLGRALTGNRVAGLLCGALAAFGSHQMSHLAHINLMATGWLALFLLGLHALVARPRWPAAVLAGVSFALSAQSSGYYAVAGALLALVFAACHRRELRDRRTRALLVAAAVVALAATAPYLHAYYRLRAAEGLRRPIGMSISMAFQPAHDLGSYGYLYRRILGAGGERLFPGLLTLVLAFVALRRRQPEARFYAIAAAVLTVVSLGPYLQLGPFDLPLPYRLLYALPAFESMRHPYTFAAVAVFCLCVMAALGWNALSIARHRAAGALVVLAALAETVAPPAELQEIPPGLPPHYAVLERLPPGPVLELPVFGEQSLVWAARHGQPVVNGQGSAFVPVDTLRLARFIGNHWEQSTPADVDSSRPTRLLLARFPVRYVVLSPDRTPNFRPLAAAFDRSRVFALVGEAADGSRVYEMRPEAAPSADGGQGREEPGEVLREDGQPVGHQ